MKIAYEGNRLHSHVIDIVNLANRIIEDLQADGGYRLTLRQLYYQFIGRDWFPDSWIDPKYNKAHGLAPDTKNTDKNYKRLGTIISSGRRCGLIDWDAIVDRTRFLRDDPTWSSVQGFLNSVMPQFRYDLWSSQDYYVELWFEKDALLEVFERAAEARRLPICSNRGYMSDSTVHEAALRIKAIGKPCVILHFSDHDPSGLDMTRDLEQRFALFECELEIKRIALTMAQVKQYKCPPNPAKETDSRFDGYCAKYGDRSWELDALRPSVMVKLVEQAIKRYVDLKLWDRELGEEMRDRVGLLKVAKHWERLSAHLAKLPS